MGVIYAFVCGLLLQLTLTADIPYASVENAISNGDASKIVSYGAEKIYLKVPEKEGVFAKSQATQILKDFFTKKSTTTFKFSYKGATTDGANAIGTYTSKGETFRVTIKWNKNNAEYEIENISIVKS